MVCVKFCSLLIGLLLSLLALGDSIAYANHAIETFSNNDHAKEANKELQANVDATETATGSKWLSGRKMATGESMRVKNGGKNTGKAVSSSKKSFSPSDKDEKSAQMASSTRLKSASNDNLKIEESETKKLQEAENEHYDTLRTDYAVRYRRSPIHNDQPSDEIIYVEEP